MPINIDTLQIEINASANKNAAIRTTTSKNAIMFFAFINDFLLRDFFIVIKFY